VLGISKNLLGNFGSQKNYGGSGDTDYELFSNLENP